MRYLNQPVQKMKKWNVIHTVFTFLFLATWAYFDLFKKLHSFYWLIFILTGFVLIFVGQIIIAILKKEESKAAIVGRSCVAVLFLFFLGYREIDRYKNYICDAQFGREFNKRRHRLGTPEIPSDWHVDWQGLRVVDWKAKDTMGHTGKNIGIDSTCAIMYENDEYKLKPINGKTRSISIATRYARGKRHDSVSYWYEPGIDTNRYITRHQADSIFAAENIKKDY